MNNDTVKGVNIWHIVEKGPLYVVMQGTLKIILEAVATC